MNATIMTIKNCAMAVLLLGITFLAPALATAQVDAISLIEPLEVIVESDCTGEEILIQGFDHFVITDPLATGNHFRLNTWGTGVGLESGTQYLYLEATGFVNDWIEEDGLVVRTGTIINEFISKGSSPNELLVIDFKVVFEEQDDGSFERILLEQEVSLKCVGSGAR